MTTRLLSYLLVAGTLLWSVASASAEEPAIFDPTAFRLLGTVVTADDQQADAVVVEDVATGQRTIYTAGDQLYGSTLHAIERGRIVLMVNGTPHAMELPEGAVVPLAEDTSEETLPKAAAAPSEVARVGRYLAERGFRRHRSLQPDDVITAVDGQPVEGRDLAELLGQAVKRPGRKSRIAVAVERRGQPRRIIFHDRRPAARGLATQLQEAPYATPD